jgi:hypothetical protein
VIAGARRRGRSTDTEIDNILANSVAIGDQIRIHDALSEPFAKRADMQAVFESLREYCKEGGLYCANAQR